jgi:hypothetical protein
MTSTKKITNSSNSSDNEKDFLEEEFLKLKIEDIPIPKAGLEDYELDIQEVMKSGCNRQIAEYVIEGIKKLEESQDNKSKKLIDLRKEYRNIIKKAIEDTINDLDDHITNKKTTYGDRELDDYDDEIDEILNSDKIQKAKNANDDLNLENIEKIAKYYLDENLKKIDKGNLEEKKKEYNEKREAVIEAALRKIKKIVNDEQEYDIFYKNYFKK